MQRRDSRAYNQNTAKSFLDGVRMQRDYEHQKAVQNNMLQQQEMARQASGRAERNVAMAEEQLGWKRQSRDDMEKLAQGLAKQRIDESKMRGKINEYLDPMTETTILGSEIDPDEKRYYFGAKDETGKRRFVQKASPRQMAKKMYQAEGGVVPQLDPALLNVIRDPAMLDLLPTLMGGQEGSGNLLYNSLTNQLLSEY